MHRAVKPEIGHWYESPEVPQQFEVVAIDEDSRCVEIQLVEGDIEEFELEDWEAFEIDEIAPPEDWTGPYEVGVEDIQTLQNDEKPFQPDDWNGPLNWIEPE